MFTFVGMVIHTICKHTSIKREFYSVVCNCMLGQIGIKINAFIHNI